MSDKTHNHEKFYDRALKCYRGVMVVVLAAGVIALFQTRELVISHEIKLINIEKTLISIESRQYDMQARGFPRSGNERGP